MNIIERLQGEIDLRLERETRYVEAIVSAVNDEGVKFIKAKLAENDKTISLIGEFLIIATEESKQSDWEKFYKERYWEKK